MKQRTDPTIVSLSAAVKLAYCGSPSCLFCWFRLVEVGSPSELRTIVGGKFAQLLEAQELGVQSTTLAFDTPVKEESFNSVR